MNEMAAVAGTDSVSERPTPMMAQYLEIKAAHPGFLLFIAWGFLNCSLMMRNGITRLRNCAHQARSI
jgi:hypothetical protein